MKLWCPNNYFSCDPHYVILAWVQSWKFLKNSWKFVVRLNFFTKTCLTNNSLSRDPHYMILAWVQNWNIFEKLMKLWSLPEIFHKNMSHEQLLFTWSTFRDYAPEKNACSAHWEFMQSTNQWHNYRFEPWGKTYLNEAHGQARCQKFW